MRRLVAFLTAGALALAALSAQTVDRAELESRGGSGVVFVNYEGPHARVDTAAQIRGIGVSLASRADALKAPARAGDGKYSVLRVRAKGTGFDADIVFLGAEAGVDHIRNLRAILQGYLQASYDFSAKDAGTFAEFITVYNAVYRKDMKYFASKYKPEVIAALDPDKAGLSLRWDEWAGKSSILIPLSDGAAKGNVSSVDTTSLTEKPVVDKMKETEPEKASESRRDITEIKEKEVEAGKKDIASKKETIAAEEKKLADEKAKLETEKKRLEEEKRKADEEAKRKAAAVDPAKPADTGVKKDVTSEKAGETDAAKGGAEESSASIKEREAEIAKKEEDLRKKEDEIASAKETVAKKEETVKAKEDEIASDRASIAEDMKDEIRKEAGAAAKPETAKAVKPMTLLRAEGADSPLSSLVTIDLVSGDVLAKSVINSIRGRTLTDAGTSYAAIAGAPGGERAVRLVLLDKEKLAVSKEGADEVFADSLLLKGGDYLYAVVRTKDGWRLGRFNSGLELKATGDFNVHPHTALTQAEGGLLAQSASGFTIVDKDTLKKIRDVGK